jgi:hypothetical protein
MPIVLHDYRLVNAVTLTAENHLNDIKSSYSDLQNPVTFPSDISLTFGMVYLLEYLFATLLPS